MSTITAEAYDEFDENLKLDQKERKAAQKAHNAITELLISVRIVIAAFLQGSFARKTMIAPLRDVDKVVVLHPDMRGLTPDQVMDRIQDAIVNSGDFPDVTFDRSRHALQVDFGETSFYFDTVPAWETDTDDDDVLIANCETGGWERSNTRELIRVVAERNDDTSGRFTHQARMGKQAIKHLLDGIIPGLHVESWAFIEVTESFAHDEAVTRILEAGTRLLGESYTEPTGVDEISSRLKPDVIAKARPVLEDAARRAREARALTDAGDHNEAIRIWHELLGDCFPEAEAQDDAAALRRSFQGGGVTSSGTVSTTKSIGQASQPVRPWRSA